MRPTVRLHHNRYSLQQRLLFVRNVRITVNVNPECYELLGSIADAQGESKAAAGGEILCAALLLGGDPAGEVERLQARVAELEVERAAGGDADLHRELVILRAEGDRLRELIQECRADKRLLEGLLHAEKQEKAMILERIPVPPSRFEGWWGRARRRLRGGDGE